MKDSTIFTQLNLHRIGEEFADTKRVIRIRKLKDRGYYFNFVFVNFPFVLIDISAVPTHGVYISSELVLPIRI